MAIWFNRHESVKVDAAVRNQRKSGEQHKVPNTSFSLSVDRRMFQKGDREYRFSDRNGYNVVVRVETANSRSAWAKSPSKQRIAELYLSPVQTVP